MALYKALMDETTLSWTKEPGSATDVSIDVLSNSEDYTISSMPWKSFESVPENTDSTESTRVLELPNTVINSSHAHDNTTSETTSSPPLTEDPNHFSEISPFAPDCKLTEITTDFICNSKLTETSLGQQPAAEENLSLTCVRSDRQSDGNSQLRETMQNLDQTVSYFNDQIHQTGDCEDQCINSESDTSYCRRSMKKQSTPSFKYSYWKTDERTDRLLGDQKNNACFKDSTSDTMSPHFERSIDQAKVDEGQTREYLLNETLGTDINNELSDQVTTDLMVTKHGHKYCDDSNQNSAEDVRKERSHALSEQDKIKINSSYPDNTDLHIQKMDASQTETLLTKIVPDPNINSEANPVLAEALARRDAMVKDLSVDGSGLKVMCCLLGVIVVFAIAIITIVVTGL